MTAFDVVVVGYGPVGAVVATLLGQAGFKVLVCERRVGVYDMPRAIALDHEILRVFQQMGVLDAVAPHCEPFTPSEFFGVDGQLIRRMTMVAPPYPQGHTPSMVFSQPPVERALRARVAQLPNVTVLEGVACTALAQDAQGVQVTLGQVTLGREKGDARSDQTVEAAWVIACDGGGSTVRGLLGLTLEDLDFDEPWLVVDVLCNAQGLAKLPTTSVQYCEPERPCTLVIGPGAHRRWEISLKPGEDPAQAATPEGTWRLLSRWLTPDDGQLWRQTSYRFHALVAERWREGRVFIAGDAAHMQPPFLGQGMCQGIRDAANLAWKLATVLRGEVTGALADRWLDSYGDERRAHVRELTSRIKAVGAVICERDAAKARARDAQMLAACGGVVKDTPRQDILPALRGGLLAASPGAGTLFPQPWLLATPGASPCPEARMDERHGAGWRWVSDGSLAKPADWPAGLASIDLTQTPERDGVVAAWMQRHGVRAAIVRPDHYAHATASDADGVVAMMVAWRQLMPAQPCDA